MLYILLKLIYYVKLNIDYRIYNDVGELCQRQGSEFLREVEDHLCWTEE